VPTGGSIVMDINDGVWYTVYPPFVLDHIGQDCTCLGQSKDVIKT